MIRENVLVLNTLRVGLGVRSVQTSVKAGTEQKEERRKTLEECLNDTYYCNF